MQRHLYNTLLLVVATAAVLLAVRPGVFKDAAALLDKWSTLLPKLPVASAQAQVPAAIPGPTVTNTPNRYFPSSTAPAAPYARESSVPVAQAVPARPTQPVAGYSYLYPQAGTTTASSGTVASQPGNAFASDGSSPAAPYAAPNGAYPAVGDYRGSASSPIPWNGPQLNTFGPPSGTFAPSAGMSAPQTRQPPIDRGISSRSAQPPVVPRNGGYSAPSVGPTANRGFGYPSNLPASAASPSGSTPWSGRQPFPQVAPSAPPVPSYPSPPTSARSSQTSPPFSDYSQLQPSHAGRVAPPGVMSTQRVQQAPSPSNGAVTQAGPSREAYSSAWTNQGVVVQAAAATDIDLSQCRPVETAQILARVGSDVILAGEIVGAVNEILSEYEGKVPEEVLKTQRRELTKALLQRRINAKLLYQDVKRKLPPEALDMFKQQLADEFEQREIPRRLKKLNLNSRRELERELEKIGTTLEREKQAFIEAVIAQQWLQQQADASPDDVVPEIGPEELLTYYREHIDEFDHPARVLWQQLTIKKKPDRPDAQEYAMLAELGNRVLRGEPFEKVAESASEGPTAILGGKRDWTTRGSLKSKKLEEALFSLPIGRLSPIIEDDDGFHIVRVLEREEAYRTPFTEAQPQIRKAIEEQRRKEKLDEYVAKLKQEIPIWTVFDDENGIAGRPGESSSLR
ncbi:peptidylprolyl isomerase [Thermostilla marina]